MKHAKVGLHPDGGGLYLQVTASGDGKTVSKSWVFRFARNGHERRMGLGSLNITGLGEARDAAEAARKLILAGKDPIEARNAERVAAQEPTSKSETFERCAIQYMAAHEASWRSEVHRRQWHQSLRAYRHPDGRAAGAVVVESRGLLHARLMASLTGADRGLEFVSGHQLDPESAPQVPANMIGRLLDHDDFRKLHRMLVKKKPSAPSVRRRTAAKRRVG